MAILFVLFFSGGRRVGLFFCRVPPCGKISYSVIKEMYSGEEEEERVPLQ